MNVYKRELTNGGYFLLNPNTTQEKLLLCEYGGENVRISHKGKTVATRQLKGETDRYFVYNKIRYNIKKG